MVWCCFRMSRDSSCQPSFWLACGEAGGPPHRIALTPDWGPSRRFSKLIDTVLGIGWVLVIGAMFIYSLGMGAP
jgi:hypothetical protein